MHDKAQAESSQALRNIHSPRAGKAPDRSWWWEPRSTSSFMRPAAAAAAPRPAGTPSSGEASQSVDMQKQVWQRASAADPSSQGGRHPVCSPKSPSHRCDAQTLPPMYLSLHGLLQSLGCAGKCCQSAELAMSDGMPHAMPITASPLRAGIGGERRFQFLQEIYLCAPSLPVLLFGK